uniref:isopenicillin N synthase family dioxygenase n=1 Tax=Ferrovibrio terrae TaxID=2594003 RepID=UPI0031382285
LEDFGAVFRGQVMAVLDYVPLIDIAPFRLGDAAARRQVAAEIDRACREIGFFIITGHGIDAADLDAMRSVTRGFFTQPLADKLKIAPPRGQKGIRGFRAVGDESLSYSLGEAAPPDLKETFRIGHVQPGQDAYAERAKASYYAPNLWPQRPAEFRTTWTKYYRQMDQLAALLMQMFAVALDLPDSFFASKIDRHISHLQANLYPAQPDAPLPGQLRAGAHTDYGSLTILLQENVAGGLQVRTARGDWVDVQTAPNDFVINIGDLMAMWTNDRWVSTLHRVANPPRDIAADQTRRMSLVFFHQPNYDAEVACLPTCQDAGAPAKYRPTTSGDHLLGKIGKANTMGQESEMTKVPVHV